MSNVAPFAEQEQHDVARAPDQPTFVVGIGASAGGLEALERFFEQVPVDSGMAFVVVQHLSPDFRSLMDEILARRTAMPVHLVEDGVHVEPNHIYLIPAKKEMIISRGRLLLSDRGADQELSTPIDVFFRSLAQDCEAQAIAIVLSGGGSDGSRGICDVHDAGGLVLVQDPETAQFDGMPRMASDAGVADAVLPPHEMPRFLLAQAGTSSSQRVETARTGEQGMGAVYRMLEREFGIDFTHYKPSTVTRRIERRLQLSRAESIDSYVQRLREEREELDVLYRDLLIGGLPHHGATRPAGPVAKLAAGRTPSGLGSRLRHRRGGLFAGHPAVRAGPEARPAAGENLRHRRASRLHRAGHARATKQIVIRLPMAGGGVGLP